MRTFTGFQRFPDGRNITQVSNNGGNDLENVVDLFLGIFLCDGQTQRAVCDLMR